MYYEAYWEVQSDRPVGWDVGRIPWSTVTRYCEIKGLSADQRDDMLHHFARMDDAFIAHMDEKRPKSGG